jgi:undecaprenyl diphosphate synthase
MTTRLAMAAEAARMVAPPPPTHIAVIMDGNGRWASARRLPRVMGHRRGVEAVRTAVEACNDLGVRYLTLYAFSSENWKRPPAEVDDLMWLLRRYLRQEVDRLDAKGVRVRMIGNRAALAPDIVDLMNEIEGRTAANTGLTLILAVNYGGQDEIVAAARALAEAVRAGQLDPAEITKDRFAAQLTTRDLPDPDLVIRTSGEQRLSNFLLWQTAYAELLFVDVLWPDFSRATLEDAIAAFHRRDRRFGA